MELSRIDTIVQFTSGSAAAWSDVNVPVPTGAIVIDTVNKIVKEGDGVALFADLPVCLDYDFAGGTSGAVTPVGNDDGVVAICTNSLYSPSTVRLLDILASLNAYQTTDGEQATRLTSLTNADVLATISEGVVEGTIVVVANGKYAAGDRTIAQLINDLIASANTSGSRMHIDDVVFYSDSQLTNRVASPNTLAEHTTYWAKITGFHDTTELKNVDFGLATTNQNVVVTNSVSELTSALIASIYGGTGAEYFMATAIDHDDNIICAGYTNSEGFGIDEALVVKFDNNLNIIAKKRYGGTGIDLFYGVAVDSANNIICVGYTNSETAGLTDALVIKFDSDLDIVGKKRFGGAGNDLFFAVAVDSADNIICAGQTNSEGAGGDDVLVVKFDPNLVVLFKKRYGGTGTDGISKVIVDLSDNIICVGQTNSEGTGNSALIIKYDTSLNITAKKIYGGMVEDVFQSVAVDSANNIIAVGYTNSEGLGSNEGLIVKFSSDLSTILIKKRFGGNASDILRGIHVLSDGSIVCVGSTTSSEGSGLTDGLIVTFDSNLNAITKKLVGSSNNDLFIGVNVDSNDNIVAVGYTNLNCLAVKLPPTIPTGTFSGTVLSTLIFKDSSLTLADSTLTQSSSNLTAATSNLTLADMTISSLNSAMTYTRDVIVAARLLEPTNLITSIYASAEDDHFNAATIDSAGNVIAVGSTSISGNHHALVVKFDPNFNALARKLYSGSFNDSFNCVIVDATDNIICIGKVDPAGLGNYEAVIVKFNSALTSIVAHKTYGSAGSDVFLNTAIDPAGNFICVGYTNSEGSGLTDALVVKFNSSLAIVQKKRYGGAGNDVFNDVAFDISGNAICVGDTESEGTNASGLIVKFDANLNIILRKIYNSTLGTKTHFNAVSVSSSSSIYCAGYIETAGGDKALVAKFDTNINAVGNKLYSGDADATKFSGIALDSESNVVCVGHTSAEGAGDYDALVVKFSSALAMLGRKTYGSVGLDTDISCIVDWNNNIIISGYGVVNSETNAMISKMPGSLPVGIYTNKYFTSLVLNDSKLILSDDTATVSNSNLAMADSNMTLTNSSMALSDAVGSVQRDVTIMNAISPVFKVAVGNVVPAVGAETLTFNVTANDGEFVTAKNVDVEVEGSLILVSIYGGASAEPFMGVAVDSNNNIICVGYTNSEGSGVYDALIVKFDTSLNILAKKRYGGAGAELLQDVVVDSNDNIICVGHTTENATDDMLVIKFDTNLNILAKKRYGGAGSDYCMGVTVDSSDNIIAVGYTNSEGAGSTDALIVKFDTNLNILSRKRYGGVSAEEFYKVCVDSTGAIIAVGRTMSEGAGGYDATVIKFDTNLGFVLGKRYGGTGSEGFFGVDVDSADNIICVGHTNSEGSGDFAALIVKFDTDLTILGKKIYGGLGEEIFRRVDIDINDNIICFGITASEGLYIRETMLVKFAPDLSILDKKRYGGIGDDFFYGGTLDAAGNIIGCGQTNSEGTADESLVVKFPPNIPSGTLTGTVLTNMTMADSNLTLAESNLTLAASTLTLNNSALTLADSMLTLGVSNLTQEKDTLG